MELNPHDLIRIDGPDDLVTDLPMPEWAAISLTTAPYVVVRRSARRDVLAPVGIRGFQRGQRLAAWLKLTDIREIIRPDRLIHEINRKVSYADELSKPILSLKRIMPVMEQTGLYWGSTGSTGFELATGVKTLTENSDLDLMLNADSRLSITYAKWLLEQLEPVASVHLDIQLNTPMGGLSLKEYASSATALVKTPGGPVLVKTSEVWNSRTDSNDE